MLKECLTIKFGDADVDTFAVKTLIDSLMLYDQIKRLVLSKLSKRLNPVSKVF